MKDDQPASEPALRGDHPSAVRDQLRARVPLPAVRCRRQTLRHEDVLRFRAVALHGESTP